MNRIKGLFYAITSSSTFGLAPFFTLSLLSIGYSSFEVLSYRWGVATLFLTLAGWLSGCNFRLSRKDFAVVFLLSLLRALTSFSLVIAYQNIASGVASTIHFMYPLAVALAMMMFYHEKKSGWILTSILMSIAGATILSSGNLHSGNTHTALGMLCACVSIFSYAGYIIGVRKTRAAQMNSTVLTCYVMGVGALIFILCGTFDKGIRIETNWHTWLYILGIALPATALSNISLVQAIKYIGPTMTSIFGAMEPLTAVGIGVVVFHESLSVSGIAGIMLIITAVTITVLKYRN